MHQLKLNPDSSERLEYTMPDMPVRTGHDPLSIFQDYAAACHWHDDFELLTPVDGEMDYFVNGKNVHLKKGACIFVNARRLHYGYSAGKQDCHYRFIVFHPSIFGELPPVENALQELCADESADYWLFEASSEAVMRFDELCHHAEAGNALRVVAGCAELVSLAIDSASIQKEPGIGADWATLRAMTGYIQMHYTEQIRLKQIAAAGTVCRNRCCVLFRKRLGCSPIEYVTRYRLEKACALLSQGTTVTEAALSCGFNSASYFTELFRRYYGITPKIYQKDVETSDCS